MPHVLSLHKQPSPTCWHHLHSDTFLNSIFSAVYKILVPWKHWTETSMQLRVFHFCLLQNSILSWALMGPLKSKNKFYKCRFPGIDARLVDSRTITFWVCNRMHSSLFLQFIFLTSKYISGQIAWMKNNIWDMTIELLRTRVNNSLRYI